MPLDTKVQDYMREVFPEDALYADAWQKESILWRQQGVYAAVVEVLGLNRNPRGVHLDIGCGLANVAFLAKQAAPQVTVIGVDRNAALLGRVAEMMSHSGPAPRVYHEEHLVLDPGKSVEVDFTDPDETVPGRQVVALQRTSLKPFLARSDQDFLSADHRLRLVVDDIRNPQLLTRLLGGAALDAVSYTFPGGSERMGYDRAGVSEFPNIQAQGDATVTAILESRDAAFDFAADRLRVGGTFVYADRAPFGGKAAQENIIKDLASRSFGLAEGRFSIERLAISPQAVRSLVNSTSWVGSQMQAGKPVKRKEVVRESYPFIVQLVKREA